MQIKRLTPTQARQITDFIESEGHEARIIKTNQGREVVAQSFSDLRVASDRYQTITNMEQALRFVSH